MDPDRAVTSLEIRLERIKRRSNLALDYLKRLYDWRPVGELYVSGEIELHVHFLTSGGMACARFHARNTEKSQAVRIGENLQLKKTVESCEFTVLVGVGNLPERLSPIASTVWLERLDCCHMRGIEAVEPSTLLAPREALWLVFNGELSAIDNATAVKDGKLINEIIECGAEVVANLSNDYADNQRDRHHLAEANLDLIRSFKIEIPGNKLLLFVPEGFDNGHKLSKVFFSPLNPGISPIKRVQ